MTSRKDVGKSLIEFTDDASEKGKKQVGHFM
jgi:hypothetical protein